MATPCSVKAKTFVICSESLPGGVVPVGLVVKDKAGRLEYKLQDAENKKTLLFK